MQVLFYLFHTNSSYKKAYEKAKPYKKAKPKVYLSNLCEDFPVLQLDLEKN